MNKREQIKNGLLYGIFICYLLVLIKILLLSRVSIVELFNSHRTIIRSFNLVPFYSISEFISGRTANLKNFAFGNVVGNIVIFIPLGVYLPLLRNNTRVTINLLFIVMASLFVEIIQGLLGIGTADVDDIILNSLGGWMGILVYKSLLFLIRDEKKAKTAFTFISVIVGLPIVYYLLFMIKMRF